MSAIQKYVQPSSMEEAKEFAKIAVSSSFSRAFGVNTPQDAFVVIATGAELGLTPFQALRNIYVVKGRPTLSAALMVALCKRSEACKFFMLVESTASTCTYKAQHIGDPEPTTLTYTLDDAKRAGLLGSSSWKQHPAAMLRARASSALARAVFPELVAGLYDPDELGDHSSAGEAVDVTPRMQLEPDVEAFAALPKWRRDAAWKHLNAEHLGDLPNVGEKTAAALHAPPYNVQSGAGAYEQLEQAIVEGAAPPPRFGEKRWLALYNHLRACRQLEPVDALPDAPPEPVVDVEAIDDGAELMGPIPSNAPKGATAAPVDRVDYWLERNARIDVEEGVDDKERARRLIREHAWHLVKDLGLAEEVKDIAGKLGSLALQISGGSPNAEAVAKAAAMVGAELKGGER